MKKFFQHIDSTISLSMLVYIAKKNLSAKKLRTSLTLGGVIIGIGAIFFLLSFGLGLQKIVTDEIVGNQSIKSIDVSSPNSTLLTLNVDSLNKFSELGNVEEVGGSFLLPGIVKIDGSEIDAVTYGVDVAYQRISNLTASYGRLLELEDSKSVLVNTSSATSVGYENAGDIVGKQINLTIPFKTADGTAEINDDFIIVGVINSGAGSEVFLPSQILLTKGAENFSQVKIVVRENDDVASVRNQVESLGYETVSPIDTIDQINQIFGYFNIILGGFGAIGMIVAILGMFNTLTISLLERTKEIGLMVALGARSRDMKRLFILEALILSISGAVIGIVLSMLAGAVVNISMNIYAGSRGVTDNFNLFSTPFWLIAGMIGFMTMIGLAVVYFPARRAEHISPIEALRRE
jgi:ABC-type antimicrobial peptide transport system permease subunit